MNTLTEWIKVDQHSGPLTPRNCSARNCSWKKQKIVQIESLLGRHAAIRKWNYARVHHSTNYQGSALAGFQAELLYSSVPKFHIAKNLIGVIEEVFRIVFTENLEPELYGLL
jgi:hypothetical protein